MRTGTSGNAGPSQLKAVSASKAVSGSMVLEHRAVCEECSIMTGRSKDSPRTPPNIDQKVEGNSATKRVSLHTGKSEPSTLA
mmetsp:Transcript_103059/g.199675  ORF Transcript_103059/g.199675 Transcript_103059/m.199675 type:complete len:82 (-) Transcript_103059:3-248(-)